MKKGKGKKPSLSTILQQELERLRDDSPQLVFPEMRTQIAEYKVSLENQLQNLNHRK